MLDSPDLTHIRGIVRRALGALVADDHQTRTELFATLRAFVAADGNVALATEACFIHKNTLR